MLHFFFTTRFYFTQNKIISTKLQHFLIHKYDLCQRPPSPPSPISHLFFLLFFPFQITYMIFPNRWVNPHRTHQMDGYTLKWHIGVRTNLKKYLAYKSNEHTSWTFATWHVFQKGDIVLSLITLSMNPLTNQWRKIHWS